MNTLYIGDKEYYIPEKLTLDKWVEVAKYDASLSFMWGKIISVIMDVPMNEVDLISEKQKEVIVLFIIPLLQLNEFVKHNEYNGGKYIDLNNITLGDFIDLDVFISEGIERNIYGIIKKLYGVEVKEGTTIEEVLGGVYHYIKWRNNIYYSYKNLFGIGGDYLQVEEDMEVVKRDIKKHWLSVIMVLAKEDVLNMNKVAELPLLQAFNWLAWHKEKIELEKQKYELQKHNRNH
jgi:hypothetical protein